MVFILRILGTVLIIKDHQLASEAKRIFEGTDMKLSLEGERHLGAVLGSDNFWVQIP
jgi:hypothetical protein